MTFGRDPSQNYSAQRRRINKTQDPEQPSPTWTGIICRGIIVSRFQSQARFTSDLGSTPLDLVFESMLFKAKTNHCKTDQFTSQSSCERNSTTATNWARRASGDVRALYEIESWAASQWLSQFPQLPWACKVSNYIHLLQFLFYI